MKVGDYVRTEYGIAKLQEITKRHIITDVLIDNSYSFSKDYFKILKSSPNIIDLIEVGDYVDRLRVVEKQEDYIVVETFDERIFIYKNIYKNAPIKSVVTKEQFSSMEYKVGE